MSESIKNTKRLARIERRKIRAATLWNLGGKSEYENASLKETESNKPDEIKSKISDEEFHAIRVQLREKKRAAQNAPLFRLVQLGLKASLNLTKTSRTPILATDVQTLLLFSVVGDSSCHKMYKWCHMAKWNNLTQTLVLIVDNVSVDDLESNKDLFSETFNIFEDAVEMCNPNDDGYSLDSALSYVPISNEMKKRVIAGYSSLQAASDNGCIYGLSDSVVPSNIMDSRNSSTPKPNFNGVQHLNTKTDLPKDAKEILISTHNTDNQVNIHSNDIKIASQQEKRPSDNTETDQDTDKTDKSRGCNRFDLLLSAYQLITEEYPLPGCEEYNDFLFTQEKYEPVTNQSPIFSLDCEWCICIDGSYGLARVAVVDEDMRTRYHTFVKPDLEIVDYLTRFSGITEELLRDVTKTLRDVQQDLRDLLPPDAILVGQSLGSDLKVLKLFHPYVIDTSVIFNLTGKRFYKSKLKILISMFCGRNIQDSSNGHDPTEDAVAAMELVLLKLKMGVEFGDATMGGDWKFPFNNGLPHSQLDRTDGNDRFQGKGCVLVDPNSSIHMKFFTFLQSHNQGATLITTHPTLEKSYRPRLLKLKKEVIRSRKINESLADPLQVIAAKNFQEAVQATIDSRLNQSFTMLHTSYEEHHLNRIEHLRKLDQAIADIYKSISLNGMMIVVFGGRNNPSQNGACFVRVNNKARNV